MRRALVPMIAAAAMSLPLAVPASASGGYPVQIDDYGVGTLGGAALPTPSLVSAEGNGLIDVGGAGELWRLTSGGELVQHRATPAKVIALQTQTAKAQTYALYQGDTKLHVIQSDGTAIRDDELGAAGPVPVGITPAALASDPAPPFWQAPAVYVLGTTTDGLSQPTIDVVDPDVDDPFGGNYLMGSFPVRAATSVLVAPDHTLYLLGGTGVSHYTDQGVYLGGYTLRVPGETNPVAPSSAALDGAGHLFVTDGSGHRVVEFALDGTYLSTFGDAPPASWSSGTALPVGDFTDPSGIAVDCVGRLWVLDVDGTSNKGRLVAFTGPASPVGSCPGPAPVVASSAAGPSFQIAIDRVGNAYVGSYGVIRKLDRAGHLLATWGSSSAKSTTTSAIGFPTGIAVLSSGDVLVSTVNFCNGGFSNSICSSSTLSPRLVEFHAAGTWVRTLTAPVGSTSTWAFPGAMAVRSDGEVFLAENGTTPRVVQELTSGLALKSTLPVTALTGTPPTSKPSVRSLAFDGSKDLVAAVQQARSDPANTAAQLFDYVGEPVMNVQVQRWTATGTSLPSWSGPMPAPADASPAGTENTGDDLPESMVPLRNGTWVWPTVNPMLYPHRATDALLSVGADGTVNGVLRDGVVGFDSAARAALDCAGDVVVLDNGRLVHLHATTAVSCLWKPLVTTGSLIARTTTTLKVRGYANPTAQVTRIRVLYGATSSHGKYTAWVTLPSDNVTLTRDLTITGLLTKHTYHYAFQVTNASGTVTGADKVATTL